MLPFHSFYICGTWRSKEAGGCNVIIRREGEKPQKEELLLGSIKKLPRELTTELLYLESPTYLSLLWCKNICTTYIRFLLTKTS